MYVGREVLKWDFDPNFLCYYTLCEMVMEAGYRAVKNFVYYEGGESNVGPNLGRSSDACAKSGEETSKGKGSKRGETNDEVLDASGGGTNYVDSSYLGSYGNDSDGEAVYRRS
ncbi:hypothetical protein J1N35_014035 [Gossypium stocksii]|uniref:Uncharacterized protein n=1 Tax=Gossypium stocksii TaxID=47602 RepID=A0A9D4A8X5_9ROSI|nr:hypothetical protein J1N35_014035 [Gossypium stocksii]